MSLGKAIAHYRKQQELTQRELAAKLDISQSYLARWETDRIRPRPDALEKIAEALEVPVEQLLLGGSAGIAASLELDDPELVEMICQIPKLREHERQALKTFLDSMLTRHRMEQMLQR